jgi:transcriptional regulator with XRE-family HTH domain
MTAMGPVEVGKRIKMARDAQGLSQEQVGNAIDATRAVVSYWEKGWGLPGAKYREALAATLKVPLSFLMVGEGERPKKPTPQEKRRVTLTGTALRNMMLEGQFDELILPRIDAMLDAGELDARLRKRGWRRD